MLEIQRADKQKPELSELVHSSVTNWIHSLSYINYTIHLHLFRRGRIMLIGLRAGWKNWYQRPWTISDEK